MRAPLSIQSRNNPKIKAVAALKESKYRRQTGLFLLEGLHELQIALQYQYPIKSVFLKSSHIESPIFAELGDAVESYLVAESVFEKLSVRQHPDGFLAVCEQLPLPGIDALMHPVRPILILDGLEKPGNHGAILRSAAAFGIKDIVLCEGQLDPYNPHVVRNSRGHSLSFQHYQDSPEAVLRWLKAHQYTSFVASPEAAASIDAIPFGAQTAIILGSEHDGVSEFWKQNADRLFQIPMKPGVDSLNVAVSASIVLWEVFKQSK